MRLAAIVVLVLITIPPATASASVEELFRAFDLFGNWARDCKQPATPDNPHVAITVPSSGLVLEDYDLGPDFEMNRYSVISAERLSPTQLSVAVIFQRGTANEERQRLVFLIRNGTRRTMFNQPEGGAVRVKNGIALGFGVKTPVLKKCG